jgi:hypothetical protein
MNASHRDGLTGQPQTAQGDEDYKGSFRERAKRVSHVHGAGHWAPASARVGGSGGAKPPGK